MSGSVGGGWCWKLTSLSLSISIEWSHFSATILWSENFCSNLAPTQKDKEREIIESDSLLGFFCFFFLYITFSSSFSHSLPPSNHNKPPSFPSLGVLIWTSLYIY